MPSPTIYRTELNAFIKSLLSSGLPQDAFEFNREFAKNDFSFALPLRLTHKESGFYFTTDFSTGEWDSTYYSIQSSPSTVADDNVRYFDSWPEVISSFESWLAKVSNEVSQPDPWFLLNEGRVLADSIPSTGASLNKLDEQELGRVRVLLEDIREFLITELQPGQSQLKLIDEKLSYLGESAKRQTKQDWAHTAIGVMFTIAIGLSMAPDQANKLFQLTSVILKTLFVKLLT